MTDINEALGIETETNLTKIVSKKRHNSDNRLIIAIILYFLAVIIAIYGLYTAYQTPTSISKIVGGDAYNYIIFASRGIVLVGFGILISIIGLAIQLSSKVERKPAPNMV